MTYRRFEDLPVWQAAIDLADKIYDLTEDTSLKPSLRQQIERSALSVSNNIAEGFERGTLKELLAFLHIAKGSAGETRSMLLFIRHRWTCTGLSSRLTPLLALSESCSRQIQAWANSLQRSDIKGWRHKQTDGVLQSSGTRKEARPRPNAAV
jgi:four helix bundle protein